jgi:hypothetical protein
MKTIVSCICCYSYKKEKNKQITLVKQRKKRLFFLRIYMRNVMVVPGKN